MGCECCRIDTPERHEKCMKLKTWAEANHKFIESLCGGTSFGKGSNYTPPKKRKKRRK